LEERKKLEESEDKIYDFAHLSHVKKRERVSIGKIVSCDFISKIQLKLDRHNSPAT
jgi:hypothetical protein